MAGPGRARVCPLRGKHAAGPGSPLESNSATSALSTGSIGREEARNVHQTCTIQGQGHASPEVRS